MLAEMAREAMDRRPNLPVLLISGYTADVLHDQGIAEDMELLHKPFRGSVLLERASALIRNWTKVTDQVVKQA